MKTIPWAAMGEYSYYNIILQRTFKRNCEHIFIIFFLKKHTENMNFKQTMLIIAFFLLMIYEIIYSFLKMLEKFNNLIRFIAPLA